jgi:hypothetical protein
LAGEFATLSQLALRGYDANMTLGNTKGVDILASDPDSDRMFRIEVKTSGYRTRKGMASSRSRLFGHCFTWIMSMKHETLVDPKLFYCFVNIEGVDATEFRFFIVPSDVVAAYVRCQHQVWLGSDPSHKDSNMRVFRLALGDEEHPLPTPTANRYENNWEFQRW